MSLADYVLDDQSGASFRAELNTILAAILSNNSATSLSPPTVTTAFMLWVNTTDSTLNIRNAANTAWIELPFRIDVKTLKSNTIEEDTTGSGVTIDNLTIKDAGFELGSDADGDIYYRSGGQLARLAKGAAGSVVQMNAGGTAPEWGTAFPATTGMMFYQASPPPDWTAVALNDYMLRVVTSGTTGGASTGTVSPITMSHTHADTLAGATHTHTAGTLAGGSHNHKVYDYIGINTTGNVYNSAGSVTPIGLVTANAGTHLGAASGGAGERGVSADMYTTNTSNTVSGTSGGASATALSGAVSTATFVPKHADVIICTKD